MNPHDYTTVIGVDAKHLNQLRMVWPTYEVHKPDLLKQPLIVFYDQESGITREDVQRSVTHPNPVIYAWPPPRVRYTGDFTSKWFHPQRYKMLAGFVHVPAMCVDTPYWLKLDTDVVAVGKPDWIDPSWFTGNPAIVAHRWGFTKPAEQMIVLDNWAETHKDSLRLFSATEPLNLHPHPDWERLCHPRIISWCGFFNTTMTKLAARCASATCGECQLPVPSQDGYLWYVSQRMNHRIERVNMKERGWEWWSTDANVKNAVMRALSHGI